MRDVTRYPEINDLYLASDALITDFSSVMFDYTVTGKPLVLFAPDLESYRDAGRGMYLDLTVDGPAPVLTNLDDLVQTCRRPDRSPAAERRPTPDFH